MGIDFFRKRNQPTPEAQEPNDSNKTRNRWLDNLPGCEPDPETTSQIAVIWHITKYKQLYESLDALNNSKELLTLESNLGLAEKDVDTEEEKIQENIRIVQRKENLEKLYRKYQAGEEISSEEQRIIPLIIKYKRFNNKRDEIRVQLYAIKRGLLNIADCKKSKVVHALKGYADFADFVTEECKKDTREFIDALGLTMEVDDLDIIANSIALPQDNLRVASSYENNIFFKIYCDILLEMHKLIGERKVPLEFKEDMMNGYRLIIRFGKNNENQIEK